MKFLLLLAAVACVSARAAPQKQTATGPLTSLSDKNARSKARGHTAFANAGRQAGLEIWRVEKFNPVAVAPKDFGKFHRGDSYIVLKTTPGQIQKLYWDIHYWIGTESSPDESGAAAILTVGLDDKFNGAAVQHREAMGLESRQFLSYFPTAPQYLSGGVAPGATYAAEAKRLYQVKGDRRIKVRQMAPIISSMNRGDCFVLDVRNIVFVYVGDSAKDVERAKAIEFGTRIRNQEHRMTGQLKIIDKQTSDADVQTFFLALGSGAKDLVPEESAGGDDLMFERSEEATPILSEVTESKGKVTVTPLERVHYQAQLKYQNCYILDTITGGIYVWVGKQSSDREKAEAMTKAQQYLKTKNYPSWVRIDKMTQGNELAVFKHYFIVWNDVGKPHSAKIKDL